MGIRDQIARLGDAVTDQGTQGRIPLKQARARMIPGSGRNVVDSLEIGGVDRMGRDFGAKFRMGGVERGSIEAMAGEINARGEAVLDGKAFVGFTKPGFAVTSVRSGEREIGVPIPRSERTTDDFGRMAGRAREVLRESEMGRRKLGAFDRGLVGLAADLGESIAEMGRLGRISDMRSAAIPLSKGPDAVEGIPYALQARMSGARGTGR